MNIPTITEASTWSSVVGSIVVDITSAQLVTISGIVVKFLGDIEAAIEKGNKLNHFSLGNNYTQKSVGLDPGFGSSAFGVCITELVDGIINVLHAEEYPRPDFNEMIETTLRLLQEYNITFENGCHVFVDGANPSFIRALKARISSEDENYENLIAHLKTSYGSNFGLHPIFVFSCLYATYTPNNT
jgi:hypothetical protein